MTKEEIKQRAIRVHNAWSNDTKEKRLYLELMIDFAIELISEAEESAFEAAREEEIVGEGAEIDLRYKYQTVEDWRKEK